MAPQLMTAEEYFAVSTEGDRMFLVGGEMVMNEPTPRHGQLQRRLLVELSVWVEGAPGRGEAFPPVDTVVSDYDVYGPDLVWFAHGRVPENLHVRPDRLPDLCVEIRSPGTWRYDVGRKKAMYEAAGLPELWLVDDAARTVLVYRRSAPEAATFDIALEVSDTLTSPLLPGFALDVSRLFA